MLFKTRPAGIVNPLFFQDPWQSKFFHPSSNYSSSSFIINRKTKSHKSPRLYQPIESVTAYRNQARVEYTCTGACSTHAHCSTSLECCYGTHLGSCRGLGFVPCVLKSFGILNTSILKRQTNTSFKVPRFERVTVRVRHFSRVMPRAFLVKKRGSDSSSKEKIFHSQSVPTLSGKGTRTALLWNVVFETCAHDSKCANF